MAKQNKSFGKQFIPWEPIPRAANQYMVANVAFFEEHVEEGRPVSIIITSDLPQEHSKEPQHAAWRITFRWVVAYRMLPADKWWSNVQPSARPSSGFKGEKGWDAALWEIVRSRWLAESTPTNYFRPLHHFVIASSYDAYEIAAASWEVESLPGNWREQLKSLRR